MSRFFRQFQHLLPDSEAWKLFFEQMLRRFFEGLAENSEYAVNFIDEIYRDLFPQTTRILEEWEWQFALPGTGDEATRRNILDARWKAQGGQSPRYLQDVVQAAGFDLYIHEWWNEDYIELRGNALTGQAAEGMAWTASGDRLFILDAAAGLVREFDTNNTYDPTQLSATGNTLNVTALEPNPKSIALSRDGLKLFVLGDLAEIFQYELLAPNELPGAQDSGLSLDVSLQEPAPREMQFSEQGEWLYVSGPSNGGRIWQWKLMSGFVLATASVDSFLDVSLQDATPVGFALHEGGTELHMFGATSGQMFRWDLSTPNQIETGTLSTDPPFNVGPDVESMFFFGRRMQYVNNTFSEGFFDYDIFRRSKDPTLYTDPALIGTVQCNSDGTLGLEIAQCGEPAAECNRFLVNDIGYLVNLTLTDLGPPSIPDDPDTYPYFLYWGDATFPGTTIVTPSLRDDLERLLLSINPAQQWLVTLVNYIIPPVGGEEDEILLATNQVIQTDQTEVIIGGGYFDGSTGQSYTWEILGTLIDGGTGVPTDVQLRLYDMGPDGAPTAGVLRSTLTLATADVLDYVSVVLAASGSPGVNMDQIQNAPRMYELRAYLDATGAVHSAHMLNARFTAS